ncbi:MAG TPA: hypothetical protein VFG69_02270 [Nannocystaceae bacterium]|nr:hypothetical protein [Nannocystaceae bacterium]
MRAGLLVVALVSVGCFSDTPDATGCPIGSKGCPCTSGGACDAALECHVQSQNCYDPECDEGSLDCPCFGGMCFADLVCIDGYCEAPNAGSSGAPMSEGSATSGSTSVDPTDGNDTGAASTAITTAADTGQTQSSDPATSDSIDPPMNELCRQCFVEHAPMECSTQLGMCMGGMGCTTAYECLEGGSWFFECCEVVADGATLWNALASCIDENACGLECSTTLTTCG